MSNGKSSAGTTASVRAHCCGHSEGRHRWVQYIWSCTLWSSPPPPHTNLQVSEGLDFADANARAVIIVGLPYPAAYDKQV